jgi:serine/threonine protein kinase
MPAPVTADEFLGLVRRSSVVNDERLAAYAAQIQGGLPAAPEKLAGLMVRDGILTHFQAEQVLQGKWRRFSIGKYKVLERLGSGSAGSVYLCQHEKASRLVAVKVLPTARADDPSSVERFYREARALAALHHPNVVGAYDIDQDEKLHFLVMEYIDGSSLQHVVKKGGPMDVTRAAHYVRQAALGLQHAHESAGLVHRDIKPSDILVDRTGVVKIIDMGLARFFHDEVFLKKYDNTVLGTPDYMAPEQARDPHSVDIRADIYALGGTFYFCLTGRSPFSGGTVAQKILWHQTRQPEPIHRLRPESPMRQALAELIQRMMAKDPAQRPQTPQEVAEALTPWTQTPIGAPPEEEMPNHCPAVRAILGR